MEDSFRICICMYTFVYVHMYHRIICIDIVDLSVMPFIIRNEIPSFVGFLNCLKKTNKLKLKCYDCKLYKVKDYKMFLFNMICSYSRRNSIFLYLISYIIKTFRNSFFYCFLKQYYKWMEKIKIKNCDHLCKEFFFFFVLELNWMAAHNSSIPVRDEKHTIKLFCKIN